MINFGMTAQKFMREYCEQNFYVQRNALSDTSFDWSDLNEILYCTEPKAPFIRLHKEGIIAEEEYTETYSEVGFPRRKIRKQAFYDLMRNGATLVMNRIDARSVKLKKLCMEVARFSQAQTIGNGYLALGGKGSFGNHWDTHDVFAVQLFGRKHWKVYKPTFPLPLAGQTSRDYKDDCPSEPVFDGILEAGDIMYIPRGWWHNALPMDEKTFHIAVGVHTAHVTEYVSWISNQILPDFSECRESLRFRTDDFQKIATAIDAIKASILDKKNFLAFSESAMQGERVVSPFDMAKLEHQSNINDQSRVRPNSSFARIEGKERATINGLDFDESDPAFKVVAAVGDCPGGTVAELKNRLGIDETELHTILGLLVDRDVIEINA